MIFNIEIALKSFPFLILARHLRVTFSYAFSISVRKSSFYAFSYRESVS